MTIQHSIARLLQHCCAAALVLASGAHAQSDAVRPEVGRPLQAAQELIRAQKFKDALAKVREADAVAGKTGNESLLVERMRMAAASGAGDVETAARAFEAATASGRLPGTDKLRMLESLAGAYYRARDYRHAAAFGQRYLTEGGTSAAVRTLLIQSQYLSGDFIGAARELSVELREAERAGMAPTEDRLKLLLNATIKLHDNSATVFAIEKLVTYHPKKEYWADLLSRLQSKPAFSDRFPLDVYRLSLATGGLSTATDCMEMAQLALQAGFPAEGKQVVDKGFAAGWLGVGPEAERHKRLRELIAKRVAEDQAVQAESEAQAQAAKDGNALVNVGLNLVFDGKTARGLALMQRGIAKGGLKRPEDAALHLGIAQVLSGDPMKAQATFKGVTGTDGAADLARLWALHLRRRI